MAESTEVPAERTPFWKNPFLLAFVIGAAALTALPFMQRRFLKAPAPISNLDPWVLYRPDGTGFGARELSGKVWVAQAVQAGCVPGCQERLDAQAALLPHLADLGDRVVLVTFVVPTLDASSIPRALVSQQTARWVALTGQPAEVEAVVSKGLRAALESWSRADAGRSAAEFAQLPSFALVDQNGAVRGFWGQDELARGNLINAARLLARRGPAP